MNHLGLRKIFIIWDLEKFSSLPDIWHGALLEKKRFTIFPLSRFYKNAIARKNQYEESKFLQVLGSSLLWVLCGALAVLLCYRGVYCGGALCLALLLCGEHFFSLRRRVAKFELARLAGLGIQCVPSFAKVLFLCGGELCSTAQCC